MVGYEKQQQHRKFINPKLVHFFKEDFLFHKIAMLFLFNSSSIVASSANSFVRLNTSLQNNQDGFFTKLLAVILITEGPYRERYYNL
jgi:hypothetical protein